MSTILCLLFPVIFSSPEHPLLPALEKELKLSMEKLVTPEGTKPYFLQYSVTDIRQFNANASLGAVTAQRNDHNRLLDVDIRCGSHQLDSSHQIRGGFDMDFGTGYSTLPLNDDLAGTLNNVWLQTDSNFKRAAERLGKVKANVKVKVEDEDLADDFSKEAPSVSIQPWLMPPQFDETRWVDRVRKLSERFRQHPQIYNSYVGIEGRTQNRVLVNSDGSKVQSGQGSWRVSIQGSTIAEDGMQLWQYNSFDAHTEKGLPDDGILENAVDQLIHEVLALRTAPVVEPFSGPAILMNRASGVFFHEIFGHRIEGHRQKDVTEGQTFAKKINQAVLPEFLSVVDDPSIKIFEGIDLNGYYDFDDECIPGQRTVLVENGVLKTFLLSRSPTRGFTQSNGHGRRSPGRKAVSRQGNLTVQSTNQVPFAQLRSMLIDECRNQGKEYGLMFKDISGGFTTTSRRGPQAFKVLPLIVYKVYVDGRPDELVRGVDIVGTPLTSFSKILATGNDPAVFNGVCGAESGWVPVSAISPSILVQQIEVEKRAKSQDRPPLLPAPISENPTKAN